MSDIIYLADLKALTDSAGSTATLRYGTESFVSDRGDSPADTAWLPRLADPGQIEQYLWGNQRTTGGSTIGFGTIELVNKDGELDSLLDWDFGGQALVLRALRRGQPYSSATIVLVALMDQVEVSEDRVKIYLRDRTVDLDVPAASVLFSSGSGGGITPLSWVRQPVLLELRPASTSRVEATLSVAPAAGNHLVAVVVMKGFSFADGFPQITDNQPGSVWRREYFAVGPNCTRMTAVRRGVAAPSGAYTIAIQMPVSGASVEGAVIELAGQMSSAIFRQVAWAPPQIPAPASLRLEAVALPVAGDYAISAAVVTGAAGDAAIVLPNDWTAEFQQNNLAASVATACSSRQVAIDGSVAITWQKNSSAGDSFAADLVVLACGAD
jgi:hypothetical protein